MGRTYAAFRKIYKECKYIKQCYCSLIISGDNLDLDLIEKTLKNTASEKLRK